MPAASLMSSRPVMAHGREVRPATIRRGRQATDVAATDKR
jgi:hypothetical protein